MYSMLKIVPFSALTNLQILKVICLFAKLAALVYTIHNSSSLGLYRLFKVPLDLYQVLDDPSSN